MKDRLIDEEDTLRSGFLVILPVVTGEDSSALINEESVVAGKDDQMTGIKEDLLGSLCSCLIINLFQKTDLVQENESALVACRGALFLKGPPGQGVIVLQLQS